MRTARFKVSEQLLREALSIPYIATIVGVSMSESGEWVELVVEDPTLPEAVLPHDVDPILTKEYVKWDWNVKP